MLAAYPVKNIDFGALFEQQFWEAEFSADRRQMETAPSGAVGGVGAGATLRQQKLGARLGALPAGAQQQWIGAVGVKLGARRGVI